MPKMELHFSLWVDALGPKLGSIAILAAVVIEGLPKHGHQGSISCIRDFRYANVKVDES